MTGTPEGQTGVALAATFEPLTIRLRVTEGSDPASSGGESRANLFPERATAR
jgi:hypothetical protein